MQFAFWTGNHNEMGQRSLDDIIMIVGEQLKALGHTYAYERANERWVARESGINVLIEGFTPATVRLIADGHARGARFLIVATEEPTDRGFNHGTSEEMVRRQAIFPEAAKFCDGIIHLVPGEHVARWYGQFAPTAYAELGYAPTLVRADGVIAPTPAFDFGFFGSLSPRRHKILKRLAKRIGTPKAVRVVADFATQTDRDRQMREACVIVQIRKYESMGLVSSSRCCTALSIGRPVVAEPHDLSEPWDSVVSFAKTLDGFYDIACVVRGAWRGVHAQQMDNFKRLLTPEVCIGRALREIGLDLGRRAA